MYVYMSNFTNTFFLDGFNFSAANIQTTKKTVKFKQQSNHKSVVWVNKHT